MAARYTYTENLAYILAVPMPNHGCASVDVIAILVLVGRWKQKDRRATSKNMAWEPMEWPKMTQRYLGCGPWPSFFSHATQMWLSSRWPELQTHISSEEAPWPRFHAMGQPDMAPELSRSWGFFKAIGRSNRKIHGPVPFWRLLIVFSFHSWS